MEATFWREKYNIQLLDVDAFDFLNRLRDTWSNEGRTIVPFRERQAIGYTQIDESTRFKKVGESFYRVVPADCTGRSNAKLFYRGGEPSWADIRDSVAPHRDGYLALMEGLFADFADPSSPFSSYLITGHAGTGKTTLIRTAAYEVARDYGLTVLVHVPGTPLDARLLSIVIDEQRQSRILVIIHHAGDYVREVDAFVDEVKRRKFPVSLILEERKNQWAARLSSSPGASRKLSLAEIDLGGLSTEEIGRILDSLQQWGSLGRLTGVAREFQEEHFSELADKELLVALRELTTEGSFDEIIRDEYEHIPTQTAKTAYVYVAALGQIHLALRYEVLARILGISSSLLGREVFKPADGVLITGEVTGSSRHNVGFRLSTRHPVIASIIFAFAAQDDESKFEIISDLIGALDPGYPEDRRLLEGIVKRKDLVNTISDLSRRREIYERLQRVLPKSAFVLQHRSILERDLRHAANAVDFARQAVALDRHNPAVLNTLGMALEFAARELDDPGQRRLLVREARKIFDDGIARHPGDPFSYIGKVNVIEHHDVALELDPSKKALLRAEVLSLLEDAYEQTGESPMLARALADQREKMGNPEHAIQILKEALVTKPGDSRIRDLLVTYEQEIGRPREALAIALGGIKFDPNSWRLQRHVARLMRVNGSSVDAVRSAYEAALRHKKGDIPLLVEFGAFLFTNGLTAAALNIFEESRKLRATGSDKRQARHWWVDEQNRRRVFSGRITRIQGGAAFVSAVPENFEAFFWRTESWVAELRETDRVQFQVAFNAMGPLAKILVKDI